MLHASAMRRNRALMEVPAAAAASRTRRPILTTAAYRRWMTRRTSSTGCWAPGSPRTRNRISSPSCGRSKAWASGLPRRKGASGKIESGLRHALFGSLSTVPGAASPMESAFRSADELSCPAQIDSAPPPDVVFFAPALKPRLLPPGRDARHIAYAIRARRQQLLPGR